MRAERRGEEWGMTTPKDRTTTALRPLLDDTAAYTAEFLEGLPGRTAAPTATAEELRNELAPVSRFPEVVFY